MADFIEEKDLHILILEDVPTDAELEELELRHAGLDVTILRVDTREAFERAVDEFKPNIVIADYRLPAYSGREALEYIRRTHPHIPVVMATGALGDEAAIELLKLGARDYVLKDRLARLGPAIRRALSEEMGIRNRKLAEGKYKALFNEALDGIMLIDCATEQIVECNPEFEKQTGRTLSQLKEVKVWEIFPAEQQKRCRQTLCEMQEADSERRMDFSFQQPDGLFVPIEFSAKYLNIQQQCFILCVTHDISYRLNSELALRESEARYKRITEGLTDYLYTVRIENGRAVETRQSAACVNVTGYRAEEFSADPYLWIQMVPPEDRELVLERVNEIMAGNDVAPIQHRIVRKDGKIRWVKDTIILFKDAFGKLLSYDGVIRDITDRVRADLDLRESEEKFHSITASAQDAILMLDYDAKISYWNAAAESIFGYSAGEALGQALHDLLAPKRFHDDFHRGFSRFKQTGGGTIVGKTVELAAVRKDGTEFPIELSLSAVKRNELWQAIGIVRDITERKQTEDALRRANRALKTLSAGNLALIRSANEDELLREVTKIIVEKGGYLLAVVDYAEDNPEKSIRPMAWFGSKGGRYWAQQFTWGDTEEGQSCIGKVIRSGTTQICHDIAGDPDFAPWKNAAQEYGYVSNIALPLIDDGRTFGGLSIYSAERVAFSEEEVQLLEELANDLAYGIITLRTKAEHEHHATILRQSLEQSIQTIAGTVEARDPYTAGHQRRVAELATAIAQELGLSAEQVNGIHFAAIIHDLGKIHIPAEILSKPGKLRDIELMLIKTHPQSGYDILKDVKFPWPIATFILQHHERLDGSGYPQGLKDEEILLESKILTVADVVEAMSSHRPYRPAIGIKAALAEVERGRGTSYDPMVVDACLRLFTEKQFKFSSK
ncbi:MAG: PAS domain S-box protein [Methylomonas sp.]